jgi:choloylglycine hydrolase
MNECSSINRIKSKKVRNMSMRVNPSANTKKIIIITIFLFTLVVTVKFGEGCTIFAASYDDTVLFGNNEDFFNYSMWALIEQPHERFQDYGGFYLGHTYGNVPQGGMNEKGLCFDGNGLPDQEMNYNIGKESFSGWIVMLMMHKCANVSEVIDMAKEYNWGLSMPYQIFFADATGDAVVLHPGTDGNINFTRKVEGDGFIASTNFNRGNPDVGQYPCWRYDTTVSILSDETKSGEGISIDLFRSILDAVHPEGSSVNTIYSNIFNPVNKMAYLYYWHQFEEVVEINTTEEIAKRTEDEYISLNDFFSAEIQETAKAEFEEYIVRNKELAEEEKLQELVAIILYPTLLIGLGIVIKKKFFS